MLLRCACLEFNECWWPQHKAQAHAVCVMSRGASCVLHGPGLTCQARLGLLLGSAPAALLRCEVQGVCR